MTKLKIGFYLMGSDSWPAGSVYIHNLFRAIREMRADNVTLCLLMSNNKQSLPNEYEALADEIVVYPKFRRWTALWAIDRGTKRLFRHDLIGEFALRRRRVSVVAFGSPPLGSKIPTLSWLPDFQHLHLPDMFSLEEREARNREFLRTAEQSDRVILLSESVRRDFQAFAPKYADKARVVSPVTYVPTSVYDSDPKSLSDLYHLPHKFVYLPNQFWKHKNHLTAFRSLKVLNDRGIEVFLVCSGYPGDHRHPNYFAELLQELSQLGIRSQVACLGLVPRHHVFMLIRQSICVLNPSVFEGYGMTVDEARSVGKQVLLSDIPVHREQNPPGAVFFNPRDCEDLARKLEQMWRDKSPGQDTELETEARDSLPQRICKYAESFVSVVREVADRRGNCGKPVVATAVGENPARGDYALPNPS